MKGTCKVCGQSTFTMTDDGEWSIEGKPVYACNKCDLEYYIHEIQEGN